MVVLQSALLVIAATQSAAAASGSAQEQCELVERRFSVPVDHFSGFSDPRLTFPLRYLDCTTFCKGGQATGCPIIFYPGNEAPITAFANASGRLFELAERFSARVVFAEERYYGNSIPPLTSDQNTPNGASLYEYLSTEQVLADYAALLRSLGAPDTPVVAIGGSYGGMLAVYLRVKYPWLVVGALGSSAPINGGPGGTPPSSFYDITAADYSCASAIRAAFLELAAALKEPAQAPAIHDAFRLCGNQGGGRTKGARDLAVQGDVLIAVLQSAFGTLAELDYPYPVTFISSELPGHPADAACVAFNETAGSGLVKLAAAAGIAYNSTGALQCLEIPADAVFEQYLPGLIEGAWTYQRCTEVVLPCEVSESNPMFLRCSEFARNCWNTTAFAAFCESRYNVTPQATEAATRYGADHLASASNILLSNGILDPWHGGGVLTNLSRSVTALTIPKSAHHLDLRATHPKDPAEVTQAREAEAAVVAQWLRGPSVTATGEATRAASRLPGSWSAVQQRQGFSGQRSVEAVGAELPPRLKERAFSGHRAFYTLFSPMLESPDWPSAYEEYRNGLVVMNPFNTTAQTIRRVKAALNVSVLMYFDSRDIQIKLWGKCVADNKICDAAAPWTHCASGAMPCCYSYNCDAYTAPTCPDDDYAAALYNAFPQRLVLREIPSVGVNETIPICLYGKGPLFVHSQSSVNALAPFISEWVLTHRYDGVYFDEYFTTFELSQFTGRFSPGAQFDADGDMQPETGDEMAAQYAKYQKAFSAEIRKQLGPDAIMIANSGVGQTDPSLNGLTIEMCANETECLASFKAQAAVAHPPFVSVMWLKGEGGPIPNECAIAAKMRAELPFLLEGTDFYDGTHVTCPSKLDVTVS